MIKLLVTVLGVSWLVSVGGCASITKGTSDVIQVEVANCGEKIPCTAANKKGSWEFDAPGSVQFKKSDDPLRIACKDGDDVVTRSVTPHKGDRMWGNVLAGGIIGAGIDASTDAHMEMPDSVTVYRQSCRGKPVE